MTYTGPERRTMERSRRVLDTTLGVLLVIVGAATFGVEVWAGHMHPWHVTLSAGLVLCGLVLVAEDRVLPLVRVLVEALPWAGKGGEE